jgi:hypothetical protein
MRNIISSAHGKNSKHSSLARQASKIKVNKKLNTLEDAPFFKKKMARANKILAVAGLPR